MSAHVEVGVRGYVVLQLKLGSKEITSYKVSLVGSPGQVVALLAISQGLGILRVLALVVGTCFINVILLAALIYCLFKKEVLIGIYSSTVETLNIAKQPRTMVESAFGPTITRSDVSMVSLSSVAIIHSAGAVRSAIHVSISRFFIYLQTRLSPIAKPNVRTYDAVSIPIPVLSTPRSEVSGIHQQLQSPLMALPGEIRMAIYRELLISKNPDAQMSSQHLLVYATQVGLLLARLRGTPRLGTSTAFLHTCRKIYEEALPILYGENVFFSTLLNQSGRSRHQA